MADQTIQQVVLPPDMLAGGDDRHEYQSEPEIGQPGMVIGATPQGPVVFSIELGDRQIVDRGKAPLHQALCVEFPILVAIGTKPVAAVIVPFIGKAHSDAVFAKGPHSLISR